MSTMSKMIMCNLNKLKYKKKLVANEKELMSSCRHLYRKAFDKRSFWLNFAVIRDPINRFISVYKYLCFYVRMCGRYGRNFPKMVDQFDRMFRNARKFTGRMRKSPMYARHHLKPQSWDCRFNKLRDSFRIIHYEENLREQWQEMFYEAGVSEEMTQKVPFKE
ncbi:unnamed protein product, partial [Mesorhabditis belari]|uniref:Carbohydrate sulfotransferase n=1 Tax=Mesorhabditis belari TaxID=2138241 RepID=A0AAF3F3D3_9BILA